MVRTFAEDITTDEERLKADEWWHWLKQRSDSADSYPGWVIVMILYMSLESWFVFNEPVWRNGSDVTEFRSFDNVTGE